MFLHPDDARILFNRVNRSDCPYLQFYFVSSGETSSALRSVLADAGIEVSGIHDFGSLTRGDAQLDMLKERFDTLINDNAPYVVVLVRGFEAEVDALLRGRADAAYLKGYLAHTQTQGRLGSMEKSGLLEILRERGKKMLVFNSIELNVSEETFDVACVSALQSDFSGFVVHPGDVLHPYLEKLVRFEEEVDDF